MQEERDDFRQEAHQNTENSKAYKLFKYRELHEPYCECDECMSWIWPLKGDRSWKRFRKTKWKK